MWCNVQKGPDAKWVGDGCILPSSSTRCDFRFHPFILILTPFTSSSHYSAGIHRQSPHRPLPTPIWWAPVSNPGSDGKASWVSAILLGWKSSLYGCRYGSCSGSRRCADDLSWPPPVLDMAALTLLHQKSSCRTLWGFAWPIQSGKFISWIPEHRPISSHSLAVSSTSNRLCLEPTINVFWTSPIWKTKPSF